MNHQDQSVESGYRCFRCQSGCVHMVCGHTMLTLPPEEFLRFADMVNDMKRRMTEETDFLRTFPKSSEIVM